MELRRRLEFRIAQQQNLACSSDRESSQHKLSVSSQQLPNGQLNRTLILPATTIPSDGVVVATKRSTTVAPMPQSTTAITTVHPQKAVTFGAGATASGAAVPTEPQPPLAGPRDIDDSGYRSSINGRNVGCIIEPADTDVLL